jgi:long-chain acyl-CoA synthetase
VPIEPAHHPGRVLARLARQVEVALATVDLTLPQYRLLLLLGERTEEASALADKLAVSRPSVTGVVDGLVARGLVERRHGSEDRRRVTHDLTDAGRQLVQRADAEVEHRLHAIAAHRPDGAATAFDGLVPWNEALDAHRAACHAQRAEAVTP